jgi:hypothetical protein
MKSSTFTRITLVLTVAAAGVFAMAATTNQRLPQLDSYNADHPAQPAFKLKPVGDWDGIPTYNLKFTGEHGDGDQTYPVTIDGHVFNDALSLAAALKPIYHDAQVMTEGLSCNLLCWNYKGELVGYNPEGYAALARGLGKPQQP